jgi:HKD family nuclease
MENSLPHAWIVISIKTDTTGGDRFIKNWSVKFIFF